MTTTDTQAKPLRLEAGPSYRTANGSRTSPMQPGDTAYDTGEPTLYGFVGGLQRIWRIDGQHLFGDSAYDIVAEWTDPTPVNSPVATVTQTRTEIRPGTYGRIDVSPYDSPIGFAVGFTHPGLNRANVVLELTAEELRAAAQTLTALADGLDAIAAERKES